MKMMSLLSGGKEVLIEAVAQAISIYAMSCIRIPKSLCDDISRYMAKFWWGSNQQRKKIHWLVWDKMCMSKQKGGLGFREMKALNKGSEKQIFSKSSVLGVGYWGITHLMYGGV